MSYPVTSSKAINASLASPGADYNLLEDSMQEACYADTQETHMGRHKEIHERTDTQHREKRSRLVP